MGTRQPANAVVLQVNTVNTGEHHDTALDLPAGRGGICQISATVPVQQDEGSEGAHNHTLGQPVGPEETQSTEVRIQECYLT